MVPASWGPEIQLDLDTPDEDLTQQYDIDEGMANHTFRAFDMRGLEDEDEDEEEEEDVLEDLENDHELNALCTRRPVNTHLYIKVHSDNIKPMSM